METQEEKLGKLQSFQATKNAWLETNLQTIRR